MEDATGGPRRHELLHGSNHPLRVVGSVDVDGTSGHCGGGGEEGGREKGGEER